MTVTDEEMARAYEEAVGHPPRTTDHPDWLYRGTKEELAALKKRMGLAEENDVIDGQLELC